MLGYPEAALTDVDQVVKGAREIGHAASLIYALAATSVAHLLVGNYASVTAQTDEAVAMAEEIAFAALRAGPLVALKASSLRGAHNTRRRPA
jgi:hypothetical protein